MNTRILAVDDEPDGLELIEFNLKQAGFTVSTAEDGEEALRKARQLLPDLIVLDVMLPEIDGLQVCKVLKNDPATAAIPIIMLTARVGEVDRILGLELGADDYVAKPFSPRELVLRVKGLLRRASQPGPAAADRMTVGSLTIDIPRHEVTVANRPVDLTATEFKLLTVLAQRRGRVQSRDKLLQDVWDYDHVFDTRTVDTHVRRLREKLGDAGNLLLTVRGVGYRLMES